MKNVWGEEEAEERRGATARQLEQENTMREPMEEVVEFECLQTGKLLQTAHKAKTTLSRPTENKTKILT